LVLSPGMGDNAREAKIMTDKYVWYACYGSNLSKERFLFYVKGGFCKLNNKDYKGCADKSEPIKDRPIVIHHRLYFGNRSNSWNGGGVAFIDPQQNREERTLGRMYLITEEQFEQVHKQLPDALIIASAKATECAIIGTDKQWNNKDLGLQFYDMARL
jgi:hypothetical protein